MTHEAEDHDTSAMIRPGSPAEASVSTGTELSATLNPNHAYESGTPKHSHMDDATADESPSAIGPPKDIPNAEESTDYPTSLETFLESLELVTVTKPLAKSRSNGLIDLERMDFPPPKRVRRGVTSPQAQEFEAERLVPSSTASHDPRATKDGPIRKAWTAPSPSVNIHEISSDQRLRRASSRSFELVDSPVNRYHSNIQYKVILWCVIAVQFPYEITVALAAAGVFGPHKSSTASFFLYSFFGAAIFGISIGVFQRMKEIKRENRMASLISTSQLQVTGMIERES